jgi:hypothetical protein
MGWLGRRIRRKLRRRKDVTFIYNLRKRHTVVTLYPLD